MNLPLILLGPLIACAAASIGAAQTGMPAEKAGEVMGWDGKIIVIKPASTNATTSDLQRLKEAFDNSVAEERVKYTNDVQLGFHFSYVLQIHPQGHLVFWPASFGETIKRVRSDPKLLGIVRERCLALEACLRERGVVAYSSSRWQMLHSKCGNVP